MNTILPSASNLIQTLSAKRFRRKIIRQNFMDQPLRVILMRAVKQEGNIFFDAADVTGHTRDHFSVFVSTWLYIPMKYPASFTELKSDYIVTLIRPPKSHSPKRKKAGFLQKRLLAGCISAVNKHFRDCF